MSEVNRIIFHERLDEPVRDRGRAHVWVGDLDDEGCGVDLNRSALSADEIKRADSLRLLLHQARFIRSRTVVRQTLGAILKVGPREVPLATSVGGQPFIGSTNGFEALHFSLSHSENVFALGVAFDSKVGVDVEIVRSDVDVLAVAEGHFLPTEFAQLKALPGEDRIRAFYKYWTAKEAFLKAVGEGISSGLTQIEVASNTNGEVFIREAKFPAAKVCAWQLFQRDLHIGGAFAALTIIIAEPNCGPAVRR